MLDSLIDGEEVGVDLRTLGIETEDKIVGKVVAEAGIKSEANKTIVVYAIAFDRQKLLTYFPQYKYSVMILPISCLYKL